MQERLKEILKKVEKQRNDGKSVSFSIAIDATKVVSVVEVHGDRIVGLKIDSNDANIHMKKITDLSKAELSALLLDSNKRDDTPQGKDSKAKRAEEVKVAIICIQDPPEKVCPFIVWCMQPQGNNDVTDFNEMCVKVASDVGGDNFIGPATDGLDSKFIRSLQVSFMESRVNFCANLDMNHAVKNFFGQLTTGLNIVKFGTVIIDNGLLRVAGVAEEVWARKDFASDRIPLFGTSHKTLFNISELKDEDEDSQFFTILTLYFLRSCLTAVNGEDLGRQTRIQMLWAAGLWLSSLSGISIITTKNLMTCIIGNTF